MSPSKIEVGKTYCNRGKGRTLRTVLEISDKLKAPWFSDGERPNEPVVRYAQNGVEEKLYLSSFASWCGREVASASIGTTCGECGGKGFIVDQGYERICGGCGGTGYVPS